jgi:7-cyano-7-deazaguanine synthase
VVAPYRGLHKSDLIARFGALPLDLTLTCMAPREGKHCGACNKCRERQEAFRYAGMSDRTRYAS